jgi:signal transduction histidine kinase
MTLTIACAAAAVVLAVVALRLHRSRRALELRMEERTAKLADAFAAANAAQERLQAIVDSMVDGVIFVDAQDKVALTNQAGRALRDLQDGVARDIRACHPDMHLGMLDRVLEYLRNGDDAGPPHSIIKEREGRYETTYAPVRSPAGEYLGIVMVTRDIAERRNLERRLLDAERLAGLGQMSAQLAHELRNPLNVIDGAAQYLARALPQSPEIAEYTTLIGETVQRVNHFIGELLHVARPGAPAFEASSVNDLARDAALRAVLARGDRAAPTLDLAEVLPVLDLDRPMVSEAIENLLENAYDAGGPAPPEIATRFEGSGGEGEVVLEVRDRGGGIPPEQLDEVQRPFVTTKATGTGLGLVVVTRAAEQHRARFALSLRDGGGTVAALRFPVRTVRAAARPVAP